MLFANPQFKGHYALDIPASAAGELEIPKSIRDLTQFGVGSIFMANLSFAAIDPVLPGTNNSTGYENFMGIIQDGPPSILELSNVPYAIDSNGASPLAVSWIKGFFPNSDDFIAIQITNPLAAIQRVLIDWSIAIKPIGDYELATLVPSP